MAEHTLTVADLRKNELKLTLAEFAERIGLKSKGQAKAIEDKQKCSVRVALAIEQLSNGRIPAARLNPDVALIEAARETAA